MKIIKPSFEIYDKDIQAVSDSLKLIERMARISHQSQGGISDNSSISFLQKSIAARNHYNVFKHRVVSVIIICDRGITHELVREDDTAITQESTRFCNYSKEKFNSETTVVDIKIHIKNPKAFDIWFNHMIAGEKAYLEMIALGESPEISRSVLSNSLKSEIGLTFTLAGWRKFFQKRCARDVHPQMLEITIPLFVEMKKRIPVIFDDLNISYCQSCEKKLGEKRIDNDINFGINCDNCWDNIKESCGIDR